MTVIYVVGGRHLKIRLKFTNVNMELIFGGL